MNAPIRPAFDKAQPLDSKASAKTTEPAAPRRRRRWPWVVLLLLAGAAAGAYGYRDRLMPAPTPAPEAAAPVEVVMRLSGLEVAKVEPARLRETVRVSGSLSPSRQAALTAQVGGRVESISVRPGETVSEGQVIAELDTASTRTQIAQQEAAIAATQAQLDLALRQLESTKALAEKGLASPSALESAQSNVTALQANLAAQQAQLAGIRLSLEYATIRAPISGIVSARNVDPGQTVGAGTTVATIVDLSEMDARVLAPLSAAAALAVGQTAELSVEGIAGRTFEAEISRINPVAVEGTRSIPIYLSLDNADSALRGGMFVSGSVILTQKEGAIAVPAGALRKDGDGDYVLAVRDNRLARLPVTPGKTWNNGRLIEVTGLAGGETIVAAPLPELAAGMAVAVEG
ncbi:MAG: efflux RND transporter periplasmic adaptor subunit [Rhizobiaceae bacterium]|nr:efflux RND transporter periplasmic adaptor subunit [Rhizobiaceae bacterium]